MRPSRRRCWSAATSSCRDPGRAFLDKPILFFWAQAASITTFGMNTAAARLPGMSSLCSASRRPAGWRERFSTRTLAGWRLLATRPWSCRFCSRRLPSMTSRLCRSRTWRSATCGVLAGIRGSGFGIRFWQRLSSLFSILTKGTRGRGDRRHRLLALPALRAR